jgi:predicted Zn-dependent protease
VAEILEWMGFIGFGAKSFYEKTGFTSGNIGQKIMGDNITITDDGLNPQGMAIPFDFEGSPREKVMLIDKGVCQGFVTDTHYASIYNKNSTGHALPPDETEGPFPLNLTIEPGDKTREEMIKTISRGILITRFHYVNGFLDPHHALMTGLTRDGTFLIEGGKITKALKGMRFTQPILKALSQVKAVSSDRRLVGDPSSYIGAVLVPSLLINNFTFTG